MEIDDRILRLQKDVYQNGYEDIKKQVKDKKNKLSGLEVDVEKKLQILDICEMEIARARSELEEVKKLKQELLNEPDGDYDLKE